MKKETKRYLEALDEFLAMFDPEELIRDGIKLIKFRYQKRNGRFKEQYFTPLDIKKKRGIRCI
jgi:hypothetical protein